MEALVNITLTFPPGMTDRRKQELYNEEGLRARELAEAGILKRLWREIGQTANWGLYEVEDLTQLHEILLSWPMFNYMTIQVHPLAENIKDPALAKDRESFSPRPNFERAMRGEGKRNQIHGQ